MTFTWKSIIYVFINLQTSQMQSIAQQNAKHSTEKEISDFSVEISPELITTS